MARSTDQKQMTDNSDSSHQLETVALLTNTAISTPVTATIIDIADDDDDDDDDNENEQTRTCRICGEGDSDDDQEENTVTGQIATDGYTEHRTMDFCYPTRDNQLIRPCKCKGSMMYVHVVCLNQWRIMSPREESYVACDLCGYRYNLRRPRYAAIVTNPYFVHTITAMCVVALTLGMAYLAKVFHIFVFNQPPRPDDPDWFEFHGRTVLWMDRVYLAIGVVCVSALGILYMLYLSLIVASSSSSQSPDTLQQHPMPWLLCCDQSGCTWYGCYLADVAACNGDAALGGLFVLVAFIAMMVIVFGIVGAAFGVYAAVETVIERIAGQVKERILEVTL